MSSGKTIRLIAIRENAGTVLLILHPIIATLDDTVSEGPVKRALSAHATQILESLDHPELLDELYPSDANLNNLNIKNVRPLGTTIKDITDRFSELDFKKNYSFIIDKSINVFGQFIDYPRVVYTLTEMMDTGSIIAPAGNSTVRISSENGFLNIVLTDRGEKRVHLQLLQLLRLNMLAELLSLLGIHFKKHLESDGYFMLGASIPLEAMPYRLREPEDETAEQPLTAAANACLSFALKFYGLLSDR